MSPATDQEVATVEQFANVGSAQLTLDQWLQLSRRVNALFAADLRESIGWGDDRYRELAERFRQYVGDPGLDEPPPFADEGPERVDLRDFGEHARGFRAVAARARHGLGGGGPAFEHRRPHASAQVRAVESRRVVHRVRLPGESVPCGVVRKLVAADVKQGPQLPAAAERGAYGHGGKPRDPGADDENLGRRHLASRRDLPREEASESVRRLDHGAVTGDVGHRGERVQLLRARDARHAVHREHGGFLRRELLE